MWETDFDFEIEWTFEQNTARLAFKRQCIPRIQDIRLTWTACNYGKVRPWFLCPSCTRRVGKIYLPETMYLQGNAYTQGTLVYWFKCRHCYDLTYLQRQSRDQYWSLLHRADRIGERWLDLSRSDWIGRLKRQRQTTFQHRADQYEELIQMADGYAVRAFEGMFEKRGRR